MDNAPFHRSKSFREKIKEWKENNIRIFYLPTYSPHLNVIEILWRFMKYEWIEFGAYKSWKTFVAYIEDVIINFGKNIELILYEYLKYTCKFMEGYLFFGCV